MPRLHHNDSSDERKQLYPRTSFSFPKRFSVFSPFASVPAYAADNLPRQRANTTPLMFTPWEVHVM